MQSYASYRTQRDAIRAATDLARQFAADNCCQWVETVLLVSGDTLHITSTPGGRITRRTEAGWSRDGLLHASRRVSSIAH